MSTNNNKYDIIGSVGEGAYGIVYKCIDKETQELVAIKKFKDIDDDNFRKTMRRELSILQQIKHENIVQFKGSYKRKGNLYLVFEYVEQNLLELLEENPNGLKPELIKDIIFQLCKALKYLHKNGMVHRDIKPENLLINSNMQLKLCDFGFTRKIPKNYDEAMTDYVATRWYRAPELLITEGFYDATVDFWSVGCIMAELTDGDPLFPGEDEYDQIVCIQKVLGNFNEYLINNFYKNSLYVGKELINVEKPETLEKRYLGKLPSVAISFMKGLLEIDYKKRLNCETVFEHPYFDDLIEDKNILPNFKNFNLHKVSKTNKFSTETRNSVVMELESQNSYNSQFPLNVINYKLHNNNTKKNISTSNETGLNQSKSTLNMTFKKDNLDSNFFKLPLVLQQLRKTKKNIVPENKYAFEDFMRTSMMQLANYVTVNNFSKQIKANMNNNNNFSSTFKKSSSEKNIFNDSIFQNKNIFNKIKLPSVLDKPCRKLAFANLILEKKTRNKSEKSKMQKSVSIQNDEVNKNCSFYKKKGMIYNKEIKKIFYKNIPKLKVSVLGGGNFSQDLQNYFKSN